MIKLRIGVASLAAVGVLVAFPGTASACGAGIEPTERVRDRIHWAHEKAEERIPLVGHEVGEALHSVECLIP